MDIALLLAATSVEVVMPQGYRDRPAPRPSPDCGESCSAEVVNGHKATSADQLGVYVVVSDADRCHGCVERARLTWAKAARVLFVGENGSTVPGVVGAHCLDNTEGSLCCKTLRGLELALDYFPEAQWLARVADDSYVFVRQLAAELAAFSPAELAYVGSPMVNYFGSDGSVYAGEGAGWVVSRPLAVKLLQHVDTLLEVCQSDDADIGYFLRYAFDVHISFLPGILQVPRFEELGWTTAAEGDLQVEVARCPMPLPEIRNTKIELWGPLMPFAAMDVQRLAMVHSNPMIWPHLSLLQLVAESLEEAGRRLLVYIEDPKGRGRRILGGPNFDGQERLEICSYRPEDRLRSYKAASERYRVLPGLAPEMPMQVSVRWAALHGHVGVIGELCTKPAVCDLNKPEIMAGNSESWTPLHFAVMGGHAAAVEALLQFRADVNAQSAEHGQRRLLTHTPFELLQWLCAGRPAEDQLKDPFLTYAIRAKYPSAEDRLNVAVALGRPEAVPELRGMILNGGNLSRIHSLIK